MSSDLAQTGVSGIATMLIVAAIALVLGLGALWLARKRSRDQETDSSAAQKPEG